MCILYWWQFHFKLFSNHLKQFPRKNVMHRTSRRVQENVANIKFYTHAVPIWIDSNLLVHSIRIVTTNTHRNKNKRTKFTQHNISDDDQYNSHFMMFFRSANKLTPHSSIPLYIFAWFLSGELIVFLLLFFGSCSIQ